MRSVVSEEDASILHRSGRWTKSAVALSALPVASYPGIRIAAKCHLLTKEGPFRREARPDICRGADCAARTRQGLSRLAMAGAQATPLIYQFMSTSVLNFFFGFIVCSSWVSCTWSRRYGAAALASWLRQTHCSQ